MRLHHSGTGYTPAMATCRVCKVEKDSEDFNKDASRLSGRRTICRVCQTAQSRKAKEIKRAKDNLTSEPESIPAVERIFTSPASVDFVEPEQQPEQQPELKIEPIVLETVEKIKPANNLVPCRICKKELPPEQFHKDRSKSSGRRTECRACKSVLDSKKREQKKKDSGQSIKDKKSTKEAKEAALSSRANQIALKTLVQRHEREFLRLREVARRNLGITPQWRQVV